MVSKRPLVRLLASFALVCWGCADRSSGSDSEGQSSGGSDATGMSTTAVEPTGADASATAGASETTMDASGGSDSGADPEVMMACVAACEHIFACVKDLPGSLEDCLGGCVETWGHPSCGQAGLDFLRCLTEMNCKQLGAYIEQDRPGMCAEAAEAADAACGGDEVCAMNGGAGEGRCSLGRECEGRTEEIQCDGETCRCVVDGEPGEGCADMGVCALELEAQVAAAQACCGWDWS